MTRLIDSTEILGLVNFEGKEWELCVSGEADYQPDARKVRVNVDAILRPTDPGARGTTRPDWLPRAKTVVETASLEEAADVARDVFKAWVRKVRETAPSIHGALI